MHLSHHEARALAEGILLRHDFDRADAERISEVLVEAHLWGRPNSGLGHLRQIVEAGNRQSINVIRETNGSVLLDGGNNPGFLVASKAMQMAIGKAKQTGLATAAARNAYLGGINGYYVSLAARQDLIAMMTTASGQRVAPAGAIDPLFGTNPIAIAIPTMDEPVILDMATAATNVGGLHRAARLGEALTPGLAIDSDGQPTTDPASALEGAILPFGGYKGSGLSMIVQCLGLLAGGAVVPRGVSDFGFFFLVIDPSLFMPAEEYKSRTSELVRLVHSLRPASEAESVRVPGERSQRQRARALDEGIEIDDPLYAELLRL